MIVIEFSDEMSNRDGCWNEIETFMNSTESNGADLLLLMGTVSNGENRGFGWWAGPKEIDSIKTDGKITPDGHCYDQTSADSAIRILS